MALNADAIIFTEYFPKHHAAEFEQRLRSGGWRHQLKSPPPPTKEAFNYALVVSRLPFVQEHLPLPYFDHQLPANSLLVRFPHNELRLLGLRVPAYEKGDRPLIGKSWDWLEHTAAILRQDRAVIVGDLNCTPQSPAGNGGTNFRSILNSDWHLGTPAGPSYFSRSGPHRTTPDQLLHTPLVRIQEAAFETECGGFRLAGDNDAISDHAALVATLE